MPGRCTWAVKPLSRAPVTKSSLASERQTAPLHNRKFPAANSPERVRRTTVGPPLISMMSLKLTVVFQFLSPVPVLASSLAIAGPLLLITNKVSFVTASDRQQSAVNPTPDGIQF